MSKAGIHAAARRVRESMALKLRHLGTVAAANVPDALLISGAVCMSYGAWLAWPPAGWMLAGVLLLVGGVIASRSAG